MEVSIKISSWMTYLKCILEIDRNTGSESQKIAQYTQYKRIKHSWLSHNIYTLQYIIFATISRKKQSFWVYYFYFIILIYLFFCLQINRTLISTVLFKKEYRINQRDFILKTFPVPEEVVDWRHSAWWEKSVAKLSVSFANLAVMATFFGEVLSVCSRAVEEEDEDFVENEEDEEIRRELEKKR